MTKIVQYEDVVVSITKDDICVELMLDNLVEGGSTTPISLMEGKFEHEIDTESACWVIESDGPHIVIYIDKDQSMWWTQLLADEQPTEIGLRNYSVPMTHLDDGTRMAIDRLIVDQKNRRTTRDDDISPA